MKYKLNNYWTEYLLKYPETGMGYQRVDIKLKTGQTIKNVVVLNAEELILPDEYADLSCDDISNIKVLDKR